MPSRHFSRLVRTRALVNMNKNAVVRLSGTSPSRQAVDKAIARAGASMIECAAASRSSNTTECQRACPEFPAAEPHRGAVAGLRGASASRSSEPFNFRGYQSQEHAKLDNLRSHQSLLGATAPYSAVRCTRNTSCGNSMASVALLMNLRAYLCSSGCSALPLRYLKCRYGGGSVPHAACLCAVARLRNTREP